MTVEYVEEIRPKSSTPKVIPYIRFRPKGEFSLCMKDDTGWDVYIMTFKPDGTFARSIFPLDKANALGLTRDSDNKIMEIQGDK